jgi:hypothetical protein
VACIVSTPGALAARPPPWCTLVMAGLFALSIALAMPDMS